MSFSIELEERCSGKSSCFKNLALFSALSLPPERPSRKRSVLVTGCVFLGDSAFLIIHMSVIQNLNTRFFESIYYNVALYALDAQFSLF